MVVTTVTPVAKRPSASRSTLSLKSGNGSPGALGAAGLASAVGQVDARAPPRRRDPIGGSQPLSQVVEYGLTIREEMGRAGPAATTFH